MLPHFSASCSWLSLDQSGGLSMQIDVLCLSHVMLVLVELILCSTRGFAWILANDFGLL